MTRAGTLPATKPGAHPPGHQGPAEAEQTQRHTNHEDQRDARPFDERRAQSILPARGAEADHDGKQQAVELIAQLPLVVGQAKGNGVERH